MTDTEQTIEIASLYTVNGSNNLKNRACEEVYPLA